MPASSDRLLVSSLRPWNPAENEPAEPNALTQSLQLTCSLTPSSTVPSTLLVIIWLKRWPARPPIELPLESEPVGEGLGDGLGPLQSISQAAAGAVLNVSSARAATAANAQARTSLLKPSFAIV